VQFFAPEVSGAEIAWAKYFLDPKNHAPDALLPLEYFSFHNYVNAQNDPSAWSDKYFTDPDHGPGDGASADAFKQRIEMVMKIRDQLSPKAKVIVDEMGTSDIVKPTEESCRANELYKAYNRLCRNATGANWAVNFINAENLGLPLISLSQMVGYPTQCPSVAMFDYTTAKPNAHYRALWLINRNFGPGDRLTVTNCLTANVAAQAAITPKSRRILLVNTTDQAIAVNLAGAHKAAYLSPQVVDLA
jgi:hypothetical protein